MTPMNEAMLAIAEQMKRKTDGDPARVARLLAILERVWLKQPNLRLGQLLSNATSDVGIPSGFEANPYYYEDGPLEAGLLRFEKEHCN